MERDWIDWDEASGHTPTGQADSAWVPRGPSAQPSPVRSIPAPFAGLGSGTPVALDGSEHWPSQRWLFRVEQRGSTGTDSGPGAWASAPLLQAPVLFHQRGVTHLPSLSPPPLCPPVALCLPGGRRLTNSPPVLPYDYEIIALPENAVGVVVTTLPVPVDPEGGTVTYSMLNSTALQVPGQVR